MLRIVFALWIASFSSLIAYSQESWQAQVEAAIQRGDGKDAIMIINRVIETTPKQPSFLETRGMIHFRLGMIDESIKDFDAVIEMNKDLKPYLWQRGIALYYAGRYAEGQEQFEVHQTVNKNDVENAAWHFLCVAKQDGVEAAKKKLITSVRDSRPPLMEALKMYQGLIEPEVVIAAADNARVALQASSWPGSMVIYMLDSITTRSGNQTRPWNG